MDFPGIYLVKNKVNGKIYVGQSVNIANRIRHHKNESKVGPSYFYRAIRKYGWDAFEFSVLERIEDIDTLDEREKFWIDALNSCDDKVGYNIIADPETHGRGLKRSEEARARMRAAQLGKVRTEEHRANIGKALIGHSTSDDTREKLRKAAMGNKRSVGVKRNDVSDETRKKMSESALALWRRKKGEA